MPVSERFSSYRTTPGLEVFFSTTAIGWPMAPADYRRAADGVLLGTRGAGVPFVDHADDRGDSGQQANRARPRAPDARDHRARAGDAGGRLPGDPPPAHHLLDRDRRLLRRRAHPAGQLPRAAP